MIPDIKVTQHVTYEKNARWPIKFNVSAGKGAILLSLRRRTTFKLEGGNTLYSGYALRLRRKAK